MVNAIGIDLGTTNCCVGVFRDGKVEIIPNDFGNSTTPSFVAFTDTGRLIGDGAKIQANVNPYNTIFAVLRLIGRKFDDAIVQSDMEHWPFKVISDEKGRPKVLIVFEHQTKHFYPEEIVAMTLSNMKESAECYLKSSVKGAVITVPASFNRFQRQAIIDAGVIAGLNVLRIVTASTAAAIAYGIDKKTPGERNVLVFDLGGATCNVSIVTIIDGIFEVKATAGDDHLGGEDFDNRLVNHFVAVFKRKYKKDLTFNPRAIRRLRTACEQAKRTLSSCTHTKVDLDHLYEGINFHATISRHHIEKLGSDLFNKMMKPVEQALSDAKIKKAKIHDVILVGGSTRIPKVQEHLSKFFSPNVIRKSINPDEAAARGAAIEAAIIADDKSMNIRNVMLLDAVPFSLGIKGTNDAMLPVFKRNKTVPSRSKETFTLSGKKVSEFMVQVGLSILLAPIQLFLTYLRR